MLVTAHLEWVEAASVRARLVERAELAQLALEGPVGDFGLIVHSGCGDGAVVHGEAGQIGAYLSAALMDLGLRTEVAPDVGLYCGRVASVVNQAADDVLGALRQAGVEVTPAMDALTNLLTNVVVTRVGDDSGRKVPVESVVQRNWPGTAYTDVLWWCVD